MAWLLPYYRRLEKRTRGSPGYAHRQWDAKRFVEDMETAAWWVARLHGADRNANVESRFRRWLAENPAHAETFELASDVWQETSDSPLQRSRTTRMRRRKRSSALHGALIAIVFALAVVVIGLVYLIAPSGNRSLATDIGEQRTLTLPDGTRVQLNSNTRLLVKYDEQLRKVILKRGEAWFNVAKQAQRPFVVEAGGQEIVALGTAFVVRSRENVMSVTLLAGRVAVTESRGRNGRRAKPDATQIRLLKPGQRLQIAERTAPVLDSPALETVTAWRTTPSR